MKFSYLLTLVFSILLLTGCSLRNPFVPHGGSVVYNDASTAYPSEPIKSKAMYRATMKPYTVQGVRYHPIVPHIGQTFTGVASWYGPKFHGNKTSNGEYFDMHGPTAAHKTLPINTMIRVTNLANNATTIVRINDRGPFVKNRIIDLSRQAAEEIGILNQGTARVKLEVLAFDETASSYCHTPEQKKPIVQTTPKPLSQKNVNSPVDLNVPIRYKVQIISTQNHDKARALLKKHAIMEGRYQASLKTKTFWQKTYYKVLIGEFEDADEAQNFIARHYFNGAFVVKE